MTRRAGAPLHLAFEDRVDFTCSGEGLFLGGYNSGVRHSTNAKHLTKGYHLNLECGLNRVFVRATRHAGEFTLNVSRPGLSPASQTIASTAVAVEGGLMTETPQSYSVALGPEPAPIKAEGFTTAVATPAQQRPPFARKKSKPAGRVRLGRRGQFSR